MASRLTTKTSPEMLWHQEIAGSTPAVVILGPFPLFLSPEIKQRTVESRRRLGWVCSKSTDGYGKKAGYTQGNQDGHIDLRCIVT